MHDDASFLSCAGRCGGLSHKQFPCSGLRRSQQERGEWTCSSCRHSHTPVTLGHSHNSGLLARDLPRPTMEQVVTKPVLWLAGRFCMLGRLWLMEVRYASVRYALSNCASWLIRSCAPAATAKYIKSDLVLLELNKGPLSKLHPGCVMVALVTITLHPRHRPRYLRQLCLKIL